MRTSLVENALKTAESTRGGRGSLTGAVFHSDHGSVDTSKDYVKLCGRFGVTQSMGAIGSSADNALSESFNAALKREVLQNAACWPDETTCRRQVFRRLVRYNLHRRHTYCRYQSPSTLRGRLGRYAANRRVIHPRVHSPGVRPVSPSMRPDASWSTAPGAYSRRPTVSRPSPTRRAQRSSAT